MTPLLEVHDLRVTVRAGRSRLTAVRGLGFTVHEGEILAIVGESGSGKSLTAMAIAGLLPSGATADGSVRLRGQELIGLPEQRLRKIRGRDIGMVFQDPLAALNPVMRIGDQISEARLAHHRDERRPQRWTAAIEALRAVHVPDPETRAAQYPHEFSGGMRQRAMIAMTRVNRPALLIADEPTTALDVTVQVQVLSLIDEARRTEGTGTIFITHDLALVAHVADRVAVMYAGRIVEAGPVAEVFDSPSHPYTVGLMQSVPRLDMDQHRLPSIPGAPPRLDDPHRGCPFEPRCFVGQGRDRCVSSPPAGVEAHDGHFGACHFPAEVANAAQQRLLSTKEHR